MKLTVFKSAPLIENKISFIKKLYIASLHDKDVLKTISEHALKEGFPEIISFAATASTGDIVNFVYRLEEKSINDTPKHHSLEFKYEIDKSTDKALQSILSREEKNNEIDDDAYQDLEFEFLKIDNIVITAVFNSVFTDVFAVIE